MITKKEFDLIKYHLDEMIRYGDTGSILKEEKFNPVEARKITKILAKLEKEIKPVKIIGKRVENKDVSYGYSFPVSKFV